MDSSCWHWLFHKGRFSAVSEVRCAVHNTELRVREAYCCPQCEAWYGSCCAKRSWWDGKRYCPKEHQIPEGQG